MKIEVKKLFSFISEPFTFCLPIYFWKMYYFADFLVFWCLFTAGYFSGYYCKYVYIYDNLYPYWFALVGVLTSFVLSIIWTVQKYYRRKYAFNHLYILFYGLICFLISSYFMLSDSLDVAFYFGFTGLSMIFIASYSFINLRCTSRGLRPMRISLGNLLFYAGFTAGYEIFNEFAPMQSGSIFMGITATMLIGTIISEILQYASVQCYKKSSDLVFNLMNEEKFVFLPTKSINNLYGIRPEFHIKKNRQWFVVALSIIATLEHIYVLSPTYIELAWSSTFSYQNMQFLSGPFLLFTIGCAIGTGLMIRYKPKFIYIMFGLIKITLMAAVLSVYDVDNMENCFYFLCFYYISMGAYSSVAIQLVLECTPFLYTELVLSLTFVIKLIILELFKLQMDFDESWEWTLGSSIASILLTMICLIFIPLLAPNSEGLIEIRNELLGIRRHSPIVQQTKIWHINFLLHHELNSNNFSKLCFEGNRIFHQYPSAEKQSQC